MKTKQSAWYELFVEGAFHRRFESYGAAQRVREIIEKEGWNVKVIKMLPTIIGAIGVQS